jgi:hypothetical protein
LEGWNELMTHASHRRIPLRRAARCGAFVDERRLPARPWPRRSPRAFRGRNVGGRYESWNSGGCRPLPRRIVAATRADRCTDERARPWSRRSPRHSVGKRWWGPQFARLAHKRISFSSHRRAHRHLRLRCARALRCVRR